VSPHAHAGDAPTALGGRAGPPRRRGDVERTTRRGGAGGYVPSTFQSAVGSPILRRSDPSTPRVSEATDTSIIQRHEHFTNGHTRVLSVDKKAAHQSTEDVNEEPVANAKRHASIDWGHLRHARQSEPPRMSSPLPQPRSHRRRLTSRRPCWLLTESLRPLAFRSPPMTDARGPHGDEIDSSSRLISTHAHDRNALGMSIAPDWPS
jgi:hypothetical protein